MLCFHIALEVPINPWRIKGCHQVPPGLLRQIKLSLRSGKQMHVMKGMLFMEVL